jgi:PAS domain S-box-containing protein
MNQIASKPGQDVEARLLYSAYARKPLSLWLRVAVAAAGLLAFWAYFPAWAILTWAGAIWGVSLLGAVEYVAFKRTAPAEPAAIARWRAIFTAQAVLTGLGWALGPTLLISQATSDGTMLLVVSLLFVCAIAMISIADLKVAMQGFIVTTLAPPAIAALMSSNNIGRLVALLLATGMVVMIMMGRIMADSSRRGIETQIRLQAILDASRDAIIGMDATGRISSWNPRAEALFGWREDEVLGRTLDDTILPVLADEAGQSALPRLMGDQTGGTGRRFETRVKRRDGSEFPVELALNRLTIDGHILYTAYIADISEHKASEERLALFRRVFDTSSQCVVISDGKGYGIYQNRAHAQALGYSDAEMAGVHFSQSLPEESADSIVSAVQKSIIETGSWEGQMPVRRKNGSQFTSVSSIGSIVDTSGRIQFLFNIFTDFSEELARRDELALAKEQAERANQAKSEFLSSMSHELRTPMNAILGFAQVLEFDKSLKTDQRESVQEILKGGHHLLKLIDEVLDLAKIESGRVTLSLEPVRVAEVVDDCWRLVQPLAAARQLTMRTRVPRQAAVTADRIRLKQVILNLVSNAIKYNREGGDIDIREVATQPGRVRIEVADTGKGIPAERLPELFQAFNRLGTENGTIEGTGIGLVITRRLVGLMGGEVGVESREGEGASFWFELPADTVMEEEVSDTATRATTQFNELNQTYCVLCIDDNPVNLKLIAQILTKRPDVKLITAHTPGLGIQLALSRKPNLILLDINMPGMDGYQVLEVLKTYASTRSIPIIAVTANATPRAEEKGGTAGLAGYLTKPLDVGKFLAAVDRCLAAPVATDS